ncbi:uncharacterized protein LOC122048807 [Zingiber officinale]|uniref:uncharacterized protein LOC122048807 n=1 Tax=Zingiber officinale TaxID=94328 RepID=UPI001C4ACEFA|nr:uncharacterized protein LOC122048807 [Zingiber officinale]
MSHGCLERSACQVPRHIRKLILVLFIKELNRSYYHILHKGLAPFSGREYKTIQVNDPTQSKSLDCAFFIMRYAESLMFQRSGDFVQADMRAYRFRLGQIIMSDKNFKM